MANTGRTYEIENLTFTYPERDNPALSNVTLYVKRGEFLVLCGPSGSGKTTLLRQLKPSAAPHGVRSGEVFFESTLLSDLSRRDQSAKIGFVTQSPDNQIVTDKVWHELAFALESLGFKQEEVRLRVAEMASFFGIQNWFYKNVTELSGGQKQMLNLASVMAMQPSVLILDEPTSQLDPIAASDFLAAIGRINRELGITVIMTEHRLEEALPLCDRAVVMDGGCLLAEGSPKEVGEILRKRGHGMFRAMPTPMRIWSAVDNGLPCPVTVRDGRNWIRQMPLTGTLERDYAPELVLSRTKVKEQGETSEIISPCVHASEQVQGWTKLEVLDETVKSEVRSKDTAIELSDVWFKYEKESPDVIKGLSFKGRYGEISAILGGNGTGKTTTLALIAGLYKPYRGKITVGGGIAALPQNPQSLFTAKTLELDLLEMLKEQNLSKDEKRRRLLSTARLCRVNELLQSHPYDLSGGEQQRAALAKVLLLQPRILLLDEPTKGLDAEFKQEFALILRKLTAAGTAVVIVSHDVEFCAEHADRCALFFDGSIVSEAAPRAFFSGNSFYTTAANRMARHVLPEAITADDVISALGGRTSEPPDINDDDVEYGMDETPEPVRKTDERLPLRRKISAVLGAVGLIASIAIAVINREGFTAFISGGDLAVHAAQDMGAAWRYVGIMIAIALCASEIVLAITWKRDAAPFEMQIAPERRRLPKRTMAAMAMILLVIPLTIYIGVYYLGDRKYYFIALLIILETMLPFAMVFESRKPQARELVVIASLCAIAAAGRMAFFMLPQFKPVIALVIITGVAFGAEAGFLVGATTAFVSNMFFGQGPWTPWQMFAFGMIGFLVGVLFRKGVFRRSRAGLCVFGAISTLVIYGGIMDTSMVLMYQSAPTRAMFLAGYLQGIPFNLVHAAATVVFLLVVARPMLEKLDRIKVKYGLTE